LFTFVKDLLPQIILEPIYLFLTISYLRYYVIIGSREKKTGDWSGLFPTVTFILIFAKIGHLKQKLKGWTCARYYRHMHAWLYSH